MAQNVNPAGSSSTAGYDKDSKERNSANSSSQVHYLIFDLFINSVELSWMRDPQTPWKLPGH